MRKNEKMNHEHKPTVLNYVSPFIMMVIGAWHYYRHGVDFFTVIPIALGVTALYLTLFNYRSLQNVLAFLTKLWYPIGQFITLAIFTLTFFVVFAPVGILLRLLKKDILNRGFKTGVHSYWISKPLKETSDYTKQF